MQKTDYYPPISDLINPDMVPEKLGFIQQTMPAPKSRWNNLVSGMHYKELVQDISRFGEQDILNETDITIKLCTNENPEPLIYHTDIVNTPSKKYGQFIGTDAIMSVGITWTKQLLFQAFNQQNGGSFQNIATYNRINFYRQTPYDGDSDKVPVKSEFHHNLFGSIYHPEINQINHHSKEVHLGSMKLTKGDINNENFTQIVEKNMTWDDEVVVFQGVKRDSAKRAKSYLRPFVKTNPHSFRSNIFINNDSKLFHKQHFKRVIIDEGNDAIKLFRLSNVNKFDNNVEYQTTLGITQAELSTLKTYTGLDTDSNVYINLERIMPTGGGTTFINSFNVEYSKFNLQLVGFDTSGNAAPANTIGNPIVVYSNDGVNFLSKAFTELKGFGLSIFNPINGLIEENFIFINNDPQNIPNNNNPQNTNINRFMLAFQQDLINQYGQGNLQFNGNVVSLSPNCSFITQTTFTTSPPNNGFTNVFVTVNPGNNTAFASPATSPTSNNPGTPSQITLFTGNWNINQGHFNNTVAHEFGHLFGLDDRYIDGGTFDGTSNGNRFQRLTIPLRMPHLMILDPNYNYGANLYSVRQNGGITPYQLSILFNRQLTEYDYNNGIAFFAYSAAHTDAFTEVFNMIWSNNGQFDGIEINDDKKTKFQLLSRGQLLSKSQIKDFTGNDGINFHNHIKNGGFGLIPYLPSRNYGNMKLLKAKTFLIQDREIKSHHEGICRFFRNLDSNWQINNPNNPPRGNPQGDVILFPNSEWNQ